MSDQFFVVTGGPGAGKTSLIEEFARRGFHTIPESGRAIIREEMASGGGALPNTAFASCAAFFMSARAGFMAWRAKPRGTRLPRRSA